MSGREELAGDADAKAGGPLVVALAMYPFDTARAALDQLWPMVREHLEFGPTELTWTLDLHGSWRLEQLLLGQTCGWPLVSQLGDAVEVVGVFDVTVPEAHGGTYRSVIISRSERPLAAQLADPALRMAVNNDDSLSGYVSLRTVCAEHGRSVDSPLFTGAHAESVRAVATNNADIASIDAVSWAFVADTDPQLVADLHVIGFGPRVPCLPLICAAGLPPVDGTPVVEHLRRALAAACASAEAQPLLAALHARGFVEKSVADYAPLRLLSGAL